MTVISQKSTKHDIRFGTDGWRAIIAKDFTYKNLNIFLDGLASYILNNYGSTKPLIIGYDARFLADTFAEFAANIINSWGISVKIVRHPVPTPVIAYAAREENSCGALTFTASHNPPEYMGIKYIPEYAGPSSKEITEKILGFINEVAEDPEKAKQDLLNKFCLIKEGQKAEARYDNMSAEIRSISAFPVGVIYDLDPSEYYFEHLRKMVNFDAIKKANSEKPKKLIYDPLHGCGINYTDKLLKEAGFDLEVLHGEHSPTFGGSLPDPKESRLTELRDRIKETGADMGAANDGDADRFSFMDESGVFYPANKSLSIILKYLVEHRGYKGVVARTLATTHLLDDVAQKLGLEVVETAVGFKWLCEQMLSRDVVLAAEESGGMSILGHIPEKDGILAILLLSEVMAITGKKLSELWDEVQDFVGKKYFYHRLDLHLDGSRKDEFMAKFLSDDLKEVSGIKVSKLDKTEGAKVYLENGVWFLARPSGTEAMCRVYLEATDQAELEKTVRAVEALI